MEFCGGHPEPGFKNLKRLQDLVSSLFKYTIVLHLLQQVSFMLRLTALLLMFMGVAFNSSSQAQVAITTPGGTDFWLYTPASYSAGTPAPMLVSLHGIGQIGSNITTLISQDTDATPAYLIAQGRWLSSRPFIVVSPQLKPDGTGLEQDWQAAYIHEVIEYVKTLRTIDINRVYLTGLSLGGQGCMIYAAAYPDKVAAMVPLCSRTNEVLNDACTFATIPTWLFHGTEDGTVNVNNSINMVNAINACNEVPFKPRLSLLRPNRHDRDFWNSIYDRSAGFEIYDWLLQFRKNVSTNKAPYVNAGIDKKFVLSANTIYLYGDYFDVDGSIASVQWTQTDGPPLTLQNTTSTQLKITNLVVGTFDFELRVTDNLGAQHFDLVRVQIFNGTPTPAVTSLNVVNGPNNSPILFENVQDGQVIYKNTMGITDINVQAFSSGGGVRFRVNEHQNSRTVTNFFPNNVMIFTPSSTIKWRIGSGDYLICATANAAANGTGTDGITKCVTISVFNQFFPIPGSDVSVLANWGSNTDGTSPPQLPPPPPPPPILPITFTESYQVFTINSTVLQNNPWTVSGTKSMIKVVSGGELTLNNTFTGIINV